MISNPAGHLGSLPQGRPGGLYLPQGNWSPFKVGKPTVLFDPAFKTLNGGNILTLHDQSGDGNDATQAVAVDQVLWNESDSDASAEAGASDTDDTDERPTIGGPAEQV